MLLQVVYAGALGGALVLQSSPLPSPTPPPPHMLSIAHSTCAPSAHILTNTTGVYWQGSILTITPPSPLQGDTWYHLSVLGGALSDEGGIALALGNYSFHVIQAGFLLRTTWELELSLAMIHRNYRDATHGVALVGMLAGLLDVAEETVTVAGTRAARRTSTVVSVELRHDGDGAAELDVKV